MEFLDPVSDLPQALFRLLVAALVGGLIGLERERSQVDENDQAFAGVRTFPLLAILGASLTLVSGEIGTAVVAGFLAVSALVVVSYLRTSTSGHAGTTTETAGLATYWIGVMAAGGALLLAAAVGVGTVVLLASKERLERFGRSLTREELTATLTFAVITAVVLPVLPDAEYGPWGVWNPRRLWIVVVLVCGLSFVGFIAMRLLGAGLGLYLSGVLGGLASSTAATVSLAGRSRQEGRSAPALALAVAAGLASLVMIVRVGVLAGISGPEALRVLIPFLATIGVAGLVTVLVMLRMAKGSDKPPELKNPFELKTALKFALVYGLVLLLVEAADRYLGSWGVFAAALISGLTDVDAITLALAGSPTLSPEGAAAGIALATLSNTAAKLGYALWLGNSQFRKAMAVILGTILVAGIAAVLVVGPRP